MTGVYEIVNKINGKKYIGQSVNIKNRFRAHKSMLRNGNHTNIILQQAWDKYGENSFDFIVIKECSIEELNKTEEYYIKKYKSNEKPFGYNIRLHPVTNRGLKWSKEQRAKMSEIINNPNSWYKNHDIPKKTMVKAWVSNKGRKLTKEHRLKISKSGKGVKKKNTKKMKLAQQGIKNPSCKLTEQEVKEIKILLTLKKYKNKEIASAYGITDTNVSAIKHGRSWKNLTYNDYEYNNLLNTATERVEINKKEVIKMKIDIPNSVNTILNKLENNGYEAYIVGGCVRDSLLNRIPNDWDICTNAKPNEILEVFKDYKTIPTGLKHGTITIVINDEQFEVTTYRVDGEYTDNRRPDKVEFTDDIVKDLSRRDFTINAMAYNNKDGLIDPFHGLNYLKLEHIKCVGNPNERFSEDGLRMLRAIRFATQLDFKIDFMVSETIYKNKNLIINISYERIRDELNKILLSDNPSKGVRLLCSLGLIDYIIPELKPCINFNQHNKNHDKDVFEHTMTVLDNIEPKLELRLAALFHDIGKPNTFTMDEDKVGHFYGHHKESAKICRDVMARLKYSNKEIEYVSELVYYHMTRYEKLRPASAKRFINKIGLNKLDDIFKLFIADRIGSKPPYDFDEIYRLKFECEKVLSEKQPLGVKDLDINGYDLIKMGVPQGKEIGDILNDLLNAVLDNPNLNNKDILLQMAKNARL